ncbi:MAG: diguanylate cyclase [Gemmatimonadaceae bacterium]|nr:diguanylate cyclase [Gemmatimonadaceae bacterium]
MTRSNSNQPPLQLSAVPPFALAASIVSLAVPVAVVLWFPDWTSNGLGMLIWLTALIPAFLLALYRGFRGVAVALAGGMAVIVATQLSVVAFSSTEPDWWLLGGIVAVYLAVSLGIGGLSEALLHERQIAQAMALVDSLTGLPNRRHLEIALAGEFASAERGHAMALVMFDLDHFKVVNDRHGHSAGDRTLQAFAKILKSNTRAENLSARFGGEEFVTVLRDTTREEAEIFAARVLDETRAWPLPWGSQTVSAGVADYQAGMGSYELLLGAADLALYRAKEAGRDCVCVAETMDRSALTSTLLADGLAPSLPLRAMPKPTALIWVVDDSAHMRSVLKGMLARFGYEHWITSDPTEAVRRFATASPGTRPDVILADVIMPEMSGPRMIAEIMKLSRDVRVIYMSAFVQSEMSWNGTPGAHVAFLEKPITMEALSGALQQMLSAEGELAGSAA